MSELKKSKSNMSEIQETNTVHEVELPPESKPTPDSLEFIWVINTSETVEIEDKFFRFEPQVKQKIPVKFLDNPWFQAVITKGYLKTVS